MEYQRIRKGSMREAPEIPRETREEMWRSNIAGALRGVRGDLDLLVMQETPPEAVEFGYFHHWVSRTASRGPALLWPRLGPPTRSETRSTAGTLRWGDREVALC